MLQGVKNIIFDLGGVIYNIDYQRTIKAFKALGIEGFEKVYAKAGQSDLFDDLETGTIQRDQFYKGIQGFLGQHITSQKIDEAWNAMLLYFMPEALTCILRLGKNYRLFLLSNTNCIHIEAIKNQYGESYFEEFCKGFEQVYLSHEIGLRKPNTKAFTYILNQNHLQAAETLFVDDSPQHVAGAIKAGLKGYHLKDDEKIEEIFAPNGLVG